MGKRRRQPVEGLKQEQMFRRRWEPSIASDDVADAHGMVVDGEGEVIGREAVGLHELVLVQGVIAKQHGPHHQVVKGGRPLGGDGLADHETLAARGAPIGLRPRNRAAAAIISFRFVSRPLLGAHQLQPLRRAEATIRGAQLQEHLRRLRVNLLAPRLDHGRLVPVHPEPAQALLDRRLAVGHEASPVRVLDAQQELPVFLAGE